MDFIDSIESLEVRAKKSRKTMLLIGAVIVLITQVMVMLIFYQYQGSELELKFKNQTIKTALEERGNRLVNDIIDSDNQTSGSEEQRLKTKIDCVRPVIPTFNS